MVQSVGRHLERNVESEESVVRLQVVVLRLYVENTNNLESERVKWLVQVGKREVKESRDRSTRLEG